MSRKAIHKQPIPFHKMEQGNGLGFRVEKVDDDKQPISKDDIVLQPHRDDHYLFLLLEEGSCSFMIDFNAVDMKSPGMVVILPAQVHHFLHSKHACGWFVAVDAALVGETFRPVFESLLHEGRAIPLPDGGCLQQCLQLLFRVQEQESPPPYQRHTLYAMITAFVSIAASIVTGLEAPVTGQPNRPLSITRAFRQLVTEKCISVKNPTEYATLLNISTSYLNEVVKATTGATVSYWIQYETMLEARRLLYHSDLTVKEVAYRTGYEDPAYFQRVFRKTLQCTPTEFRNRYRELSNINL